MAGTGIRSFNEAWRALSISPRTASRVVAGGLLPSCRQALGRVSGQVDESHSRSLRRSMATEASPPNITTTTITPGPTEQAVWNPISTVPVTIHDFPSLEPSSLEEWSVKHLYLPLRRDLLHLAVVYEGDKTRQGTASSKTRWDVRASGRKLRPQKGTGKARLRDAASPLLRGGGKTFGPQPRDFSTRLNRKVYDVAWRTALSYRYRRGELIVCADGMDLPLPKDYTDVVEAGYMSQRLMDSYRGKYVKQVLAAHHWGREFGRTTFVTTDRRKDLHEALENVSTEGRALELEDVDVKDLLETGRIVIERRALKEMIKAHQSDLVSRIFINGLANKGPPIGEVVVE